MGMSPLYSFVVVRKVWLYEYIMTMHAVMRCRVACTVQIKPVPALTLSHNLCLIKIINYIVSWVWLSHMQYGVLRLALYFQREY